MSDLDRAIRTPADIRAWFAANAGTLAAHLAAERAVRAILGLHDEARTVIHGDLVDVCSEDGQQGYASTDLPGCRTTRAIDAEINHVLRGVGVSGEDRSEPTPAPREPRAWPVDSPEPKEKGLVVVGENGVPFRRSSWGDWEALPPKGDGLAYRWARMNHGFDGQQFTEVVTPEGTP